VQNHPKNTYVKIIKSNTIEILQHNNVPTLVNICDNWTRNTPHTLEVVPADMEILRSLSGYKLVDHEYNTNITLVMKQNTEKANGIYMC